MAAQVSKERPHQAHTVDRCGWAVTVDRVHINSSCVMPWCPGSRPPGLPYPMCEKTAQAKAHIMAM
eukprot:1606017-Prorocentrum_lima.AAC.1